MKRTLIGIVAILSLTAVVVNAQETAQSPVPTYPRLVPGNLSYNAGLPSPFEDAVIHTIRGEQGWTLWRNQSMSLTPYLAAEGWWDDRQYDWNNKVVGSVGIKATKTFEHGVVQLGGAYIYEKRRISGETAQGFGVSGNYWFGWDSLDSAARSSKPFSSFPGSTYGYGGTISPVERGNVIGSTYARQGVVLTRVNRIALIPFGDALYKVDSKRYDWNNSYTLGLGGGVGIPMGTGILEGGWAYKWETRTISHTKAQGPVWFVNFWYGWSPAAAGSKRKESK